MSDELNVSALAKQICGCATVPQHLRDCTLIRDYGDKRYQQAIADVVEWLNREIGQCDCFARSETECACGAWDDYKTWPLERTAQEIARRFGKDA